MSPATKVPRPPVERRLSAGSSVSPASDAYVAFGNVETRNTLQARIEVPLLIRALGLPRGGRVLEIGCGRGIALPVLAE
jgi:protein-L-isoaspartate O-methyltransferase